MYAYNRPPPFFFPQLQSILLLTPSRIEYVQLSFFLTRDFEYLFNQRTFMIRLDNLFGNTGAKRLKILYKTMVRRGLSYSLSYVENAIFIKEYF